MKAWLDRHSGLVNGDMQVNDADFDIILANWCQAAAAPNEGDLNRDGLVGWFDFREWKENRTPDAGSSGVPEPCGAILALLAGAGLWS